ncbi:MULTISPECIES: flagellar hook assembly protein FlgD [unclassified Beijerinckia]|uniref:flagellar hook assembly protein FlgD n=1 Tax=unclassified Beijerinckia TaxID=2638183 RepID=UPI00089CA701|nr:MULTISPECIES: flagellar hook assembly protein FlgD [unclassified Beijerinckia]MDH7798664.1 flagellar basal-body rod modification protein FlgD [Beijerinckia sp. GAS462]SED28547.1 flagellar basal-body rod modification protein FlgD [Beijerinckia sp. 28-YEA-48]
MQVNSATQTSDTSTTSTAKAQPPTVDYNAFLTLLVAQMKNQDPTKPTDSTEFLSQLASFSNVEQTVQMNSKLGALLTNSALSQADGIIGRKLTSADGAITGTVSSVTLQSGGLVAILDNGNKLAVTDGVTVS